MLHYNSGIGIKHYYFVPTTMTKLTIHNHLQCIHKHLQLCLICRCVHFCTWKNSKIQDICTSISIRIQFGTFYANISTKHPIILSQYYLHQQYLIETTYQESFFILLNVSFKPSKQPLNFSSLASESQCGTHVL